VAADLTVAATPGYFATMGAEHLWLKRRAARRGVASSADYTKPDTITSLSMGIGSLLVPIALTKLLEPLVPGKGRFGKVLVRTAIGAATVTTVADVVVRRARRREQQRPRSDAGATRPREQSERPDALGGASAGERGWRGRALQAAERVASAGGVVAVATGGLAVTTTWASLTRIDKLWNRRFVRDLGGGPLAIAAAVLGWDFIYYWNHRFMHESRYMWAVHVVHHSSEHYNLSTALRQPVADPLGTFAPYGLLSLFGIRPELVSFARDVNLLYQYWIHTDTVRTTGPFEEAFNTPSHHRVHHGSNREYIDRNHGSILITWDRLFGTFEREDADVVYGLTKNIHTYSPWRVMSHEHVEMLRDVAQSTNWRDRLSYVVRGPGWAYARHAERDGAAHDGDEIAPPLIAV
jgi:sterol desaturase/sphingolipid hydroxylase (fatty acid hydroxylase superfamily)